MALDSYVHFTFVHEGFKDAAGNRKQSHLYVPEDPRYADPNSSLIDPVAIIAAYGHPQSLFDGYSFSHLEFLCLPPKNSLGQFSRDSPLGQVRTSSKSLSDVYVTHSQAETIIRECGLEDNFDEITRTVHFDMLGFPLNEFLQTLLNE